MTCHFILSIQTCTNLYACISYCLCWRLFEDTTKFEDVEYVVHREKISQIRKQRLHFFKKKWEKLGEKWESCGSKKAETATWSSRGSEEGRKWYWQAGLLGESIILGWKNGKGSQGPKRRRLSQNKVLLRKACPIGGFQRPSLQFSIWTGVNMLSNPARHLPILPVPCPHSKAD